MKNTIILILSLLVIGLGSLVIFDKVIFKEKASHATETSKIADQEINNIQISNSDIKLKSLDIEKFFVDENGVNTKISVIGKIELEFDENKYEGVKLSGYCLDTNDTKYVITGPSDGRALYKSGLSDLYLSENLTTDAIYKDGTVKSIREINWTSISLKSCKVEKITGFAKENNNQQENNEKSFIKLKAALTNSEWINNNLYAKVNCFGNSVGRENQKLEFEVLHDNENNPIVVVLDLSFDDFVVVSYKVYVENNNVVVKNIIDGVAHPAHVTFNVDKQQGLVIYKQAHMGIYKFIAYDIKGQNISVFDEYKCETGSCEYEYRGNKAYNLSDITLELNNENVEKYVK